MPSKGGMGVRSNGGNSHIAMHTGGGIKMGEVGEAILLVRRWEALREGLDLRGQGTTLKKGHGYESPCSAAETTHSQNWRANACKQASCKDGAVNTRPQAHTDKRCKCYDEKQRA